MDRWRIARQSLSLPTPLLAPLNDYINLCNTGKQLQPTCNIFDKFPDLIIQGRNTTQINYDPGLKFMQILILFVFFFSFVSAEMSCSCSKTCVVKKMTKSCMKACNDYFSRKWWETNPLQIISYVRLQYNHYNRETNKRLKGGKNNK